MNRTPPKESDVGINTLESDALSVVIVQHKS